MKMLIELSGSKNSTITTEGILFKKMAQFLNSNKKMATLKTII